MLIYQCLSGGTGHDVINIESRSLVGTLLVKGSEESLYHSQLLPITATYLRYNYTKHAFHLPCIAPTQVSNLPNMVKDNETVIEYAGN